MSTSRTVVVPDMPEHIFGCLSAAEELLMAMQNWDDVPADAHTRTPLGDRAALQALHRIWDLLRSTQSDQQGRNPNTYTGPQWLAGDGNYQLTNLSLIEVPASDIDLIGAAVAELTGDNLNGNVDDRLAEENRRQYQSFEGRETVTRPLVTLYQLLMLPADHDSQALQHVLTQAGERDRLVLSSDHEAATTGSLTSSAKCCSETTRPAATCLALPAAGNRIGESVDNTPMHGSSARLLLAGTLAGLLGGIVILAAWLVTLARDDLIARDARAFLAMAAFVLLAGGAVCAAVLRAAARKKADAAAAELIRTHNERHASQPSKP